MGFRQNFLLRIIYHPKKFSFKHIFQKYGFCPSDQSTVFLLPGVPIAQEIEDYYCDKGIWGNTLITFKELSDRVNEISPELKKKTISGTQALAVVGAATSSISDELQIFGNFSQNRDFLFPIVSIISRLKQCEISPKMFLRVAEKTKDTQLREKISDIGLIYREYEKIVVSNGFLEEADALGAVSREIDRIGLEPFLPSVNRLVVFGFSDFTPRELDVIKSLSKAVSETFFFICDFEELHEYQDSFFGTLSELSISFDEDHSMLAEEQQAGIAREFHEFRDAHDEIQWVARQIKTLVVDEGRRPCDFRVLVDASQKRGNSIAAIFEKNGLAFDIRGAQTLAETVYGRFAKDILNLRLSNFHRSNLIRLFHNPLFSIYLGENSQTRLCVMTIEDKSSATGSLRTVNGIAGWMKILDYIDKQDKGWDETTRKMRKAFDLISSGFYGKSFSELTSDLRKILSKLNTSKSSEVLLGREDVSAESFEEFFSFLKDLSFFYGQFDFEVSGLGEYIVFLDEIMRRKSISSKTPCDSLSDRVKVGSFYSARGVNTPFIFLVGLCESVFPSRRPLDPVLKQSEKTYINRLLGKDVFEKEGLQYEREKHLFSTLTEAAAEKVFFSCFRRTASSDEIRRSNFLEEIENCFTKNNSLETPKLHRVFSQEDILQYRVLSAETVPQIAGISEQSCGLDLAGLLRRGVVAERQRLETSGTYSQFEGMVSLPVMTEDTTFSATQLETYGTCPFMYFSKNVLGLPSQQEPEELSASQIDLGSLAHKILGELMKELFRLGSNSVDTDYVLKIYQNIKKSYISSPVFSHLPQALSDMEKKRFFEVVMPNFILDEVENIKRSKALPVLFEKEFVFYIKTEKIRGRIDRVDMVGNKDEKKALVIDYKVGSVQNKKFYDYKNLQLPLYMQALRWEGEYKEFAGYYLSIRKPEENINRMSVSDQIDDSKKDMKKKREEAVEVVEYYLEKIKQGFFPPYVEKKGNQIDTHQLQMANGPPCSYCDYSDLCRVKDGVIRRVE